MKNAARIPAASWFTLVLLVASWNGALAQDAKPQSLLVPAVSFSGQGGGEVKKTAPAKLSDEQAAPYVHFWYTPGHWLEWTFDAPAAGEYQLSLRYATKYKVQRAFRISDRPLGPEEKNAGGLLVLPATGRWSDWKDASGVATVRLVAGKNVLRLACVDDCSMFLGEIKLSAEGKAPIVLKAGEFSGQGGGTVQVLRKPADGYFREWTKKDQWVEWKVTAPAAGEYDVHLLYATDDLCPRELKVNGEVAKGDGNFSLPSTGDDRNWTEARLPAAITLKKGENVLRLTSLGGETSFDLSAIRLTSPPAKTPDITAFKPQPDDSRKAGRADFKAVTQDPASLGPAMPSMEGKPVLKAGDSFAAGGLKAKLSALDSMPYVSNAYSSRFTYEPFDNPLLKQFREQNKLDQVIAAGKDEFEKQLLLMEWAYNLWDFGHGRERYDLVDPFEIVQYAKREHHFQCMHSSAVFQAACNSLGWVSRKMAIPQHTFNEVWSNQYKKWILCDATSNYTPERKGVPLNTFELRQGLLYDNGKDVVSLRHRDGNFSRTPKDPKYGQRLIFVGYIPNTNSLQSGPDYGKMFITKDKLAEGKKWHTRECPADPATEPYFPIDQAAMALLSDGKGIQVTLGTMMPNFKEFQVRIDGGEWKASGETFTWTPHKGANKLEARSVNKFGVAGPVSTATIDAE